MKQYIETTYNPRRAAKILNDHCRATCAGFYGSVLGSRFFQARVRNGTLEIFDFDTWFPVQESQAVFHDHNGRNIPLY